LPPEATAAPAGPDPGTDRFFFTRTPALELDGAGIVVEINAALRELFGVPAAGCKGQHFLLVEQRLCSGIPGALFPPDGLAMQRLRSSTTNMQPEEGFALNTEEIRTATRECLLETESFGPIRARASELPRLRGDTGLCTGSILSLEVLVMADLDAFRTRVDRRLGHELMWEVYAASYDRILPEMPFYREVVERHCEALSPDHIQSVLDLGAGTGNVAVRLARLGKRVIAVDIARAMLERLKRKIEPSLIDRLQIIEDTAEHLPQLRDESVDGVNVLLALFDMSDALLALKEAVRTLRPGGVLAVTEPRACFNVDQLMAFAEDHLRRQGLDERLASDWKRIQSVAPLIHEVVVHAESGSMPTSGKEVWHAEAIFNWLRENAFEELTFRESHHGNCATIIGKKPLRYAHQIVQNQT
jgi:ubiquinone/menaquinone biosynthesis C-methylase UbiE